MVTDRPKVDSATERRRVDSGPGRRARSGAVLKSKRRSGKVLPRAFYARPTLDVATDLLGKLLFIRDARTGASASGRIVETEAYFGRDPASHSARGKTSRNSVMFGTPGRAYMYLCYGTSVMLNVVARDPSSDEPGAVLIRALEPVSGIELMRKRRGTKAADLTNGPGKLCQALGLRLADNGISLQGPRLAILDDGEKPESIVCSPRVGITKATERLWRFHYDAHPHVSRAKENRHARKWREHEHYRDIDV